jgi:hypothetical protein
MYNAEMRGSRRRSAGGNNHQGIAKARRGSGRSGQIDTNGSGLTCTEQQFFRRHTAHESMRIGNRNVKRTRRAAVSDGKSELFGAAAQGQAVEIRRSGHLDGFGVE